MIVVLGTAHLASTPGKRSPDGKFREYAYSREICRALKDRFIKKGIDCDIDIVYDDIKGYSQNDELRRRVQIVNNYCTRYGTQNVIYVSIHVNAASNGEWKNATGFSVYTTVGNTKSDLIATEIYKAAEAVLTPLKKKLRKDMSDGDPDYESNFYILKNTKCPAVLTENFFQDNKSDVEWLLSEEGKKAVIDYHFNGILNYLKK